MKGLCLFYLDDIIIFSESEEKHEYDIIKVLEKLAEFGLTLSIKKCIFAAAEVVYL